METLKPIQIENLDNAKTAEIVKDIEQKDASDGGKQELKLKLHSTKGNTENALEVITTAHGAENVDLTVEVSGSNGVAGAILTAAGKPGCRIAQMGSTFTLNEGDAYEQGTKATDLEPEDKVVYETLTALTGKRKYILAAIVKGGSITGREAKKCGIIDSISVFRSKYLIPKPKKDTNTQVTSAAPAQTPETVQTNAVENVPSRRGRKKSINA